MNFEEKVVSPSYSSTILRPPPVIKIRIEVLVTERLYRKKGNTYLIFDMMPF